MVVNVTVKQVLVEEHVIIANQGTMDLDHKVVSVSFFYHLLLNNNFIFMR